MGILSIIFGVTSQIFFCVCVWGGGGNPLQRVNGNTVKLTEFLYAPAYLHMDNYTFAIFCSGTQFFIHFVNTAFCYRITG